MNHGRYRAIGAAVLLALGVAACSPGPARPASHASASASVSDGPATDFATVPPGGTLPTAARCAQRVRAVPGTEIRPGNGRANHTTGQQAGPGLFPSGDSPQAAALAPLISGDFTGTTQQILEWAACKWGISQDVVFAQAAAESSWSQSHVSDWGSDPALCPPGHGLGVDGMPGQCPQSYGILQTKYTQWPSVWPAVTDSTAMNADVTYAIWRSCFDGDEIWLNNSATPAHPYRPGDLWGCVGRWFAGSWYTPGAENYIQRVQHLLAERVWQQPSFISGG
jgi:hypothetical protein